MPLDHSHDREEGGPGSRVVAWLGPALVACVAAAAVIVAIDPAGSYPAMPQGPGLTVDERFNVEEGVRLAVGMRAVRVGLTELFNDDNPPHVRRLIGNHLADHPPLGRIWIGVAHQAATSIAPPHEPASPFVVAAARVAPATAFGLTVFLVGWVAGRWYGAVAGLTASVSLVLMPRVFGHAHLASLETFIGLTYTAAVLDVAHGWLRRSRRPGRTESRNGVIVAAGPAQAGPTAAPRIAAAAWAGLLLGLALLTKIQAVFLPAAVGLWALWRWRWRAILPLVVWGGVGLAVLFAGWPWLWLDPLEHLREYVGRTADRAPLNVWYFGTQYADRAVPWHYPLVMFLVTVPAGLHVLGACGLFGRGRSADQAAREQLLLAAIAVPLIVFSWPGIAVYDGARLFLVVFPLWAVFIGRGGAVVLRWLKRRLRTAVATTVMVVFVLVQAVGTVLVQPAYLSYYNLLAGGLPGARTLGLELSYWGDSMTRELLREVAERVPAGATIDFTPVLEPRQLDFLLAQAPILRERKIDLRPFEDRFLETGDTRYLLYFHRHADIARPFHQAPPGGRLLAEVRRQGVQLAALYAFDEGQ